MAKAPEIDEEDMNVVFTTNVTGLINMTQAILPIFQKRPNGGQGDIINIGSIAGMFFLVTSRLLSHPFALMCDINSPSLYRP